MARSHTLTITIVLAILLLVFGFGRGLQAQEEEEEYVNHVGYPAVFPPPEVPPDEPPFSLPFTGSPGPDTWFLGQAYGNTTRAFILRTSFQVSRFQPGFRSKAAG